MPSLKGERWGMLCPWWHHQPMKPPQNYQPLEIQKRLNLVGGQLGAAPSFTWEPGWKGDRQYSSTAIPLRSLVYKAAQTQQPGL